MVRTKLDLLKKEIANYVGLPYFINPPNSVKKSNLYSGKGHWQEIKAISSDYKFLKKNLIGIDCSGLVYHLLDFYTKLIANKPLSDLVVGTNNQSDVRHLSAHLLTSPPNSIPITNLQDIKTGDLIRTKSGHHVIFIINLSDDTLNCVQSSRQGRGVKLCQIPLSQISQTDGVFRLKFLNDYFSSTNS